MSDEISVELPEAIGEAEIVETIDGTDETTVTQVEDRSTTLAGRPRCSIWDYFIYDKTKDKSVCQCTYKEPNQPSSSTTSETVERKCETEISGKYPTNLKGHVRKFHPTEYQEMLKKEGAVSEKKQKRKSGKAALCGPLKDQPVIAECFVKKYERGSERYQKITRKLAMYVASNNVAISVVENEDFMSLIGALDSRYGLPGRTALNKEIDKLVLEMNEKVSKYISEAKTVHLCADIWTKKA